MAARKKPDPRRAREASRGRAAESPRQVPAAGWKDTGWRVWQSIGDDHLSLVAAGTAFFGLLAIFPALTAFVSIYGLVADPATIQAQVEAMRGVVPDAGVDIIEAQLTRIVEQSGTTHGLTFIIGLAAALWSANAGMKSLFEAMNVAYDEDEERGFVRRNLVSMALTVGAIIVLALFLGAIAVVPAVIAMMGLEGAVGWLVALLPWPVILALGMLALAVLYRVGPSRELAQWSWVTPGSVVAAIGLIVASVLLSFYFANFANYNETYGSLGAVIGLMVWFWISALVVLIGAEVNAELEHQTAEDTTTGRKKQMDRRGARMADRVGRSSEERDRQDRAA
ncbi:MAG: YihY/virulence factor BrkB family protein [Hyphomicrobiales bacterium]